MLIFGDFFLEIKQFEPNTFDAIITDPNFGTTKCPWDTPIDLAQMWVEFKRVAKPNAPIVMFAQTPFDKVLGCSNLPWLRYEWIWEKTQASGFFNAKKMPMKAHENILVFYEKLPLYNPQYTHGHKPTNSYTKYKDVQNKTSLYGGVKADISGGGETHRYPRSVLKFSSDKQKTKLDGTIHPTQKPLALMEYLVSTYTNVGDTILDPFGGSGTTGLAAQNLSRNWVLMEKEPPFVEICKKRLKM